MVIMDMFLFFLNNDKQLLFRYRISKKMMMIKSIITLMKSDAEYKLL